MFHYWSCISINLLTSTKKCKSTSFKVYLKYLLTSIVLILNFTHLVTTPEWEVRWLACGLFGLYLVKTGYWALRAELIIYLCWMAVKPIGWDVVAKYWTMGDLKYVRREGDVFCYIGLIKEIFCGNRVSARIGLYELIEYCTHWAM